MGTIWPLILLKLLQLAHNLIALTCHRGIAINHLNTPRRIPQAALHKVQLSGQAG